MAALLLISVRLARAVLGKYFALVAVEVPRRVRLVRPALRRPLKRVTGIFIVRSKKISTDEAVRSNAEVFFLSGVKTIMTWINPFHDYEPPSDPEVSPRGVKRPFETSGEQPSANAGEARSPALASRQPLIQYWAFRFTGSKIPSTEHLLAAFNQEWIVAYGFQLEAGEKNKVLHYQGSFEVEPRKRFDQLNEYFRQHFPELIFDNKRDYLQKCRSKAADRYGMKEETRVRGPWYKGLKFEQIAKETVYKVEIELRPWQKRICEILNGAKSDRHIWWFWEPHGGLGKSTFQKWLYQEYEGVLALSGKASDMKNGVVEYHEKMKAYPKLILVNLPKTFNADYFSATGAEEVKDMFFYSPKFHGGMVWGRNPTMLCFANCEPPCYESMAADRWRIIRLPDGAGKDTEVFKETWDE